RAPASGMDARRGTRPAGAASVATRDGDDAMTTTQSTTRHPIAPATLEQAGLNPDLMQQLLLKTLYFSGELIGTDLAKRVGLAFSVIEPTLEFLKQQRLCEIGGGSVFGNASYRYRITDAGRGRASLALEQNQYVGIAPVPLAQYQRYMLDFKA